MPRPEIGPWTPGKLYTPSNGSEGDVFMARWCERCAKDGFTEEHPENGCKIIVESMCGMEPPQWVIDAKGWPMCAEFKEAPDA